MSNPYFNPDYNPYPKSVLIGTAILFIILPIASVSLRFLSRTLIRAPLAIDDWMTIPSMLICIGLSINQIIAAVVGGLGSHQQLVNGHVAHTKQLYVYEKTKYAYQLLGTIGLWVIKLSVLFFYRRIFSVGALRIVNTVFMCLTVAWGLAFTFTVAFQCTPVSTLWNEFEIEYGNACIKVQDFYLAVAISDLILDIMILALPIPHLWVLQMPLRQKLAVGGMFLTGSIVIAIGVTRVFIFSWVVDFTTAQPLVYFSDITYYTAGTLFWHLAENVIGLLGCCLPTYRPLFKSLLQKPKSSSGRSSDFSSTKDSRKRNYPGSPYGERLDDEYPLASVTASKSLPSNGSVEGRVNENEVNLPQGRIMVERGFHTETLIV